MKYLNKFDTTSDYQQSASTLEIPNVAYITATTDVIYNATQPKAYVVFTDPLVASKCATLYGDGTGCTEADLAAVRAMSASDWSGTSITSFDELRYFTGLTSLPQALFMGCSSLTSVTIPRSADTMGEGAFSGCSSLSAITFLMDTPPSMMDAGVFDELPQFGNLAVPEGFKDNFYQLAESLGGWMVNGEIPVEYVEFNDPIVGQKCVELYSSDGVGCTMEDLAAVTTMSASDWSGTGISSFDELGNWFTGLNSLPIGLFKECSDLTSVSIPIEVRNIDASTFAYCTSLQSVELNNVSRIWMNAFYNCSALEYIFIPPSVTQIDGGAFLRCSGLTSIEFMSETPPTVGNHPFKEVSSTGNIIVPGGYESNYYSIAQSIGAGWTVNNQSPS